MDNKALRKGCALALAIVAAAGVAFYFIAREQLLYRVNVTESVTSSGNVGEMLSGDAVEQAFSTKDESLTAVEVMFLALGRANTGSMDVRILDGGETLFQTELDVSTLEDYSFCRIPIDPAIPDVANRALTLRIESDDGTAGNAVSVCYGNSINTGRVEVAVDVQDPLRFNGEAQDGQLCMTLTTIENLWFGEYYWYSLCAALLALACYCAHLIRCNNNGTACMGLRLIGAVTRYRFLMSQMILRDFKTKYKRSALGVFWSFLNPLLTMLVQYIIFSTLFRSNIPNYPVYLLSGIVCFNFFKEAIDLSMNSITGNAQLITKVYVPKYIFPLSRTLSSGINLLLSMIPLLLMMLVTGQRITSAIFLLPIGLVFLVMFCLGMGLLLSASMVFFRDTQFIWNVFSLIWMYATPIFYPESIIPAQWMVIYKLNPLYHIIRIFRIILIGGASPEPKAYLLCFISAFVPLAIGALVFKRTQDRFILHI